MPHGCYFFLFFGLKLRWWAAGNSLIGLSSDSLVFCQQKSDSLAKKTNRSRRSFVMSDLSESPTVTLLERAKRANRSSCSLKKSE